MKQFLFCTVLLFSAFSQAQKSVFLTLSHKLGDNPFSFNQNTSNDIGHNYEFTRVDYYISGIKIIHDGGQSLILNTDKHLLIKAGTHSVNHLGDFDVENVEGITFSIGVHPSLNNEDPALQPSGTPLAFQSPSMHWGWASGYFFACLEGKCGTTLPLFFQLHGLWNQNYFEQTIAVQGSENDQNQIFIHLDADYNEALRGINLNACPTQHGTNQDDLTVLENFRDHVFSAGDGSLLNIASNYPKQSFSFYPNPVKNELNIQIENFDASKLVVQIVDLSGRILKSHKAHSENTNIALGEFNSGIYFVQILYGHETILNQKIAKE